MQGMCTTCIAKVIKGEFRYIEEPEPDTLSQEDIENNSILLCIATPLTDLLIELDDE
jgi:Ferredoxin